MSAWVTWTAATWLFAADIIAAFVAVCGSSWAPTAWQILLIYIAIGLCAVMLNTAGFRLVPGLCKGMLFFINVGAVFILVALLVRVQPKQNATSVFVQTVNNTGWSSEGVVFLLALLPGITATIGFDAASHMTDEVPDPAKQVSRVMIGTILLCGLAGIPMTLVFLFCNTRPENLLTPIGGQPIMQLFLDGINSHAVTITSSFIYVGLFAFASTSILTTTSPCWWSFALCDAYPVSSWQGKVGKRFKVPTNAILVVTGICILIGLLQLGPTTVLSSVVGTAAIFFYISYCLSIACMLLRGRKHLPPTKKRSFHLGRYLGPMLNIISLSWSVLVSVFLCFPIMIAGLTLLTMSYTSVVVSVIAAIFGLDWVSHARKSYATPR